MQYLFDQIRLVDLNKLKISTRKLEAEILLKNNGVDPDITEKNAAKSLGGVIVKTFQVYIFFIIIHFLQFRVFRFVQTVEKNSAMDRLVVCLSMRILR